MSGILFFIFASCHPLIHGYLWPQRHAHDFFSASFPSCSPPFHTNHLISICSRPTEGFFLFQNAKPPQILPYILFISLFFILFFIHLYIFSSPFLFFPLNFLFSSFLFPQNLEFFPKWKNYSPAFEAKNRRIDTPASLSTTELEVLNGRERERGGKTDGMCSS